MLFSFLIRQRTVPCLTPCLTGIIDNQGFSGSIIEPSPDCCRPLIVLIVNIIFKITVRIRYSKITQIIIEINILTNTLIELKNVLLKSLDNSIQTTVTITITYSQYFKSDKQTFFLDIEIASFPLGNKKYNVFILITHIKKYRSIYFLLFPFSFAFFKNLNCYHLIVKPCYFCRRIWNLCIN